MMGRVAVLCGLLALSLSLPTAGWAQPVYKTVGPDGKVSYSDTPPPSGTAQTVPGVNQSSKGASMGKTASPASSAATGKPASTSTTNSANDPVVKAAMTVYGKEIIVVTGYRFCRDHVPETEKRVKAAHDVWLAEHIALRTRKSVILKDKLSSGELNHLAASSERENENILGAMRNAPAAEKKKWCDAAPTTFASSEFNLNGNAELSKLIRSYQPKNSAARQ